MLNTLAIVAVLAIGANTTIGTIVRVAWNRFRLRSDPAKWLRARGVVPPDDPAAIRFMWVRGRMGGPDFIRLNVAVVVLTPGSMFVECELPAFLRRGRLTVAKGERLRIVDGKVGLPRQEHFIASRDPSVLIAWLEDAGWVLRATML